MFFPGHGQGVEKNTGVHSFIHLANISWALTMFQLLFPVLGILGDEGKDFPLTFKFCLLFQAM